MPSGKIKGTELRVLATYQSRSNPRASYRVLCNKSGRPVMCDCPGWTFNRKCWHMERCISLILKKHGVE